MYGLSSRRGRVIKMATWCYSEVEWHVHTSDVRPTRIRCSRNACGQPARVLERHDCLQPSTRVAPAATRLRRTHGYTKPYFSICLLNLEPSLTLHREDQSTNAEISPQNHQQHFDYYVVDNSRKPKSPFQGRRSLSIVAHNWLHSSISPLPFLGQWADPQSQPRSSSSRIRPLRKHKWSPCGI